MKVYEKKEQKLNFLKKLYLIFKIKSCRKEYKLIGKLNKALDIEQRKVSILIKMNNRLTTLLKESHKKTKEILKTCIEFKKNLNKEEELEIFWNNKRPKSNRLYKGRPDPTNPKKNMWVDPRIYFQHDSTLPTYKGTYDEIACKCLDSVKKTIKYTSDKGELWQFAHETLKRKLGDCDDFGILLANMLIMSRIPYYRVRITAGNVKSGGHLWITYLSEKDNQWYVLDATYYYNECKGLKKKWKDAEKYMDIWFSFNRDYIFEGATLDKTKEKKTK